MKLYCEFVVGEIFPALRALITNELIKNFDLTQNEIASRLGVTQPAISQYKKYLRGERVKELEKNKKAMRLIKDFSKTIADKQISAESAAEQMLKISHMIVDEKIIYDKEIIQHNFPCDICFK